MKHQPTAPAASARLAMLPALATALVLTLPLAGCGSGSPSASGPVTVTVTPTVTAPAPATTTSAPATTTSAPAAPRSDVVGRAFDFGTITRLSTLGGVDVIELDRWTVKGLADTTLARSGHPVAPYTGDPFQNLNAKSTFTIPVAPGATILWHHCAAASDPIQTRSATLKELAALGGRENKILVKLDQRGYVVDAQNFAAC